MVSNRLFGFGRSRKSEGRFLTDTDISWGQQVVVMFQINIDPDIGGAVLFGGNGGNTGHVS